MKRKAAHSSWVLVFVAIFLWAMGYGLWAPPSVRAAVCGEAVPQDEGSLRDYIKDCQAKIDASQATQATLASAISYLNNQISLTEAQIASTETELQKLGVEITDLSGKIEALDYSLDDLTKLFVSRVQSSYKEKYASDAVLSLFNSGGFSQFFRHIQYVQAVRDHDQEVMVALESARLDFDQQKTLKEEKQAEIEALKQTLDAQEASLVSQKAAKAKLLQDTQNNEKRFQELRATALADLDSIRRALSSIGTKIGEVQRNEIIASVGNTGCSTGPHLHFEVFKDAKIENGKVQGTRANPHDYLGQFQDPLPGSIITADYGESYILGIHTGVDFAYPFSMGPTLGSPIYAAEGGTAYATEDTQPCKMTGTVGKGIVIDHHNGLVTLYWHLP